MGPVIRVRPAIRVRPDVFVWPGNTRLASKACLATGSKACFTSRIRTMSHQQNDFPPANALTAIKPTPRKQARSPNAPSNGGRIPTGEQAGPDGTPPKALNFLQPHLYFSRLTRHCLFCRRFGLTCRWRELARGGARGLGVRVRVFC